MNLVLLRLLLEMHDNPNLRRRVPFSSYRETVQLWLICASQPLSVPCEQGARIWAHKISMVRDSA